MMSVVLDDVGRAVRIAAPGGISSPDDGALDGGV